MTQTIVEGNCFCGSVQYQVSSILNHLCFCHCESCRRAAGGAYVPWGTCKLADFVVTGGQLVHHQSSEDVNRGFCKHCGTSITYQHNARGEEIDIALVTLVEPKSFEPQRHIWVQDKLPWINISDGLPQFNRGYNEA